MIIYMLEIIYLVNLQSVFFKLIDIKHIIHHLSITMRRQELHLPFHLHFAQAEVQAVVTESEAGHQLVQPGCQLAVHLLLGLVWCLAAQQRGKLLAWRSGLGLIVFIHIQ